MDIASVIKTVHVRLAPTDAFDLFARQLTRWWPLAQYSCGGTDAERVEVEMRIGGSVIEHTKSGARHVWGTVTAWDPPHGFAMTWHPAHSADEATRLRVEFLAGASGGTEVRLTHDGWEAREAGTREAYDGGWSGVLARYVAAAEENT